MRWNEEKCNFCGKIFSRAWMALHQGQLYSTGEFRAYDDPNYSEECTIKRLAQGELREEQDYVSAEMRKKINKEKKDILRDKKNDK